MTHTLAENRDTLPTALLPLMKQHLRVVIDDEDELITEYLRIVIDYHQHVLGQQIFNGTVSWMPGDSAARYQCPVQPVSAFTVVVDSVTVTSEYTLEQASAVEPVWLVHSDGTNFPADAAVSLNVGFADADDLPPAEKGNILRDGATLYEHRESVTSLDLERMPLWLNDALGGLWIPRA
jgi:hypothetical protein